MRYLLLFLLICFGYSTFSQINSRKEYDRLYSEFETLDENLKLDALINLGSYQRYKNPEIAINLLERALILTKKLDTPVKKADAIRYLGGAYEQKRMYNKAINLYQQSIEIGRSIGDSLLVVKGLHNIAFNYDKQENHVLSLKYHLYNLKVELEINDKEGLGYTYNHLGLIYDEIEEYDKADSCYHLALNIRKELNHKEGLGYTYQNLGKSYKRQKRYDKSIDYIDKAAAIFFELGDTTQFASLIHIKGHLFFDLKQYKKAKMYYQKALDISQEKRNPKGVFAQYINLGRIEEYHTKDLKKAQKYYTKALDIAKANDFQSDKDWSIIYYNLHSVAYYLENYKDAFSHLGDYFTHREKMFKRESKEKILDLESRYELDKKEAQLTIKELEIKRAEKEKLSLKEQLKKETYFIVLAILIVALLLFILIQRNKNIKLLETKNSQIETQQNQLKELNDELISINDGLNEMGDDKTRELKNHIERLERKNEQLSEFAFLNAHEVRGPLARILGIFNLWEGQKFTNPTEERNLLIQAYKEAKMLDGIVSDINRAVEKDT